MKAKAKHSDIQRPCRLAHMPQMLSGFAAGFMQIIQRRTRQFQLPARFQRDRAPVMAADANHLALFKNWFGAGPQFCQQTFKQGTDTGFPFIGNRRQVGTMEKEFFMFRTDLEITGRSFASSNPVDHLLNINR